MDKAELIEEVKHKKSVLEIFAENELNIIINKCEDEDSRKMQEAITRDILQIVQMFAEQGHSGFSANYAISLIEKLLRYEPLTELTGNENEWTKLECIDDGCYQNKRCSRIFKDEGGQAYDLEGKIFSEDGGKSWFTCKDSKVYIDFPYIPHTEEVILENNLPSDEKK